MASNVKNYTEIRIKKANLTLWPPSTIVIRPSGLKTVNVQSKQDLSQMVKTKEIKVKTKGNCDVVNITEQVRDFVGRSGVREGAVTVFNVGSTGAITTTEYEPGLVNYDIAAAFERIAPRDASYEHEETWHDDNGHSHVRASVLGPSLSVPVVDGKLMLGTWQQIILVDFDTRVRTRTVVIQIVY